MLAAYYGERLVGHIGKARPGLTFQYDPMWLPADDTFQISLQMPFGPDPFPHEVATPWFANLLPEDRQLQQIGRLLGKDTGDVYGLLEEIGRDTAGALSIGAGEPKGHYKELSARELASAIERLPERPLLAGEEEVTMSLAGAQTKLAVAVFDGAIYLPLGGAPSTHILKPASDRFFASVENELLCMTLGRRVGLQIARVKAGRACGQSYLLVDRYDRRYTSEPRTVLRYHQEDFCQALGRYPTEKYENSGGPGFADIFNLLSDHSLRPAKDRLHALDLLLFGCCIGDTDRHAKNYSLLIGRSGASLAPGYDFMTSLPYDGITKNMAMKIGGKRRGEHLERRHWEGFARQVGLSPSATVARAEKVAKSVQVEAPEVAKDLAERFELATETLDSFAEQIVERARAVANNARRGPSAKGEASVDHED